MFNKYFIEKDFRIIGINNNKLGSFFHFKDRLPKGMQSFLVYKFSCLHCKSEYIGSTIRSLYVRIAEHAGRSSRTNNILCTPNYSNIREHSLNCDCPISINNFSILGRNNQERNLRILESLFIAKHKPSINNMLTAHPLYVVQ